MFSPCCSLPLFPEHALEQRHSHTCTKLCRALEGRRIMWVAVCSSQAEFIQVSKLIWLSQFNSRLRVSPCCTPLFPRFSPQSAFPSFPLHCGTFAVCPTFSLSPRHLKSLLMSFCLCTPEIWRCAANSSYLIPVMAEGDECHCEIRAEIGAHLRLSLVL